MSKKRTFFDEFFKDKDGKVVLWQTPNAPLLTWAFVEVVSEFIARGSLLTLCSIIAFGSLFTWAWLEAFQGVNYFRRALGIVVLVVSVLSKVK